MGNRGLSVEMIFGKETMYKRVSFELSSKQLTFEIQLEERVLSLMDENRS